MSTVALLGDSIFDNKAYVGDDRDVAAHLRSMLTSESQVLLLAVDGSTADMVAGQASAITDEVDHLVISTGGNNALMNADILSMRASTSAEVLHELSNRASAFLAAYTRMLDVLERCALPTTVCTIYYPRFSERTLQKVAVAALASFNDIIILEAFRRGLPLIDLRLVCDSPDDYANEIEPSGNGGRKIARAIRRVLDEHDFSLGKTIVYI